MKSLLVLMVLFFSQMALADISLEELGVNAEAPKKEPSFSASQMRLRTEKLKTHEVLGLITLGAMTATYFTGGSAMDNNTHMYLGMTTAALYMTTAYYSLTAPKPMGVVDRGRIKWHKGLAWVHFPAMILTPILGYMYKRHEEDGKKHGSLESQHSTVATILYGSFAISAALMVVEF